MPPEQITNLQALILGVVEGVTEFLPISSTGHLLVTSQVIGAASTSGTFEIVIQLGAIVAVVLYYWKKLWRQAQSFPASWEARRFWFTLFTAFLPAAVVGLALHKPIKMLLSSRELQCYVIAGTLIIGGIILWFVDRPRPEEKAVPADDVAPDEGSAFDQGVTPDQGIAFDQGVAPDEDGAFDEGVATVVAPAPAPASDVVAISFRQAIWIGIAQCFSLIPGVSRSGATIVGGLLVGLDRRKATEFSFYLSIPTLGAATLYTFAKEYEELLRIGNLGSLTVGTVVSFITAWAAIAWLLRYVSSHDFRGFAVYRIVAGLAILIWAGMTTFH